MRTCDHCGTQNDDTRVFCKNCGTRLTAAPSPGPSEPAKPAGDGAPAPSIPAAGVTAPPLPRPSYRRPKPEPKRKADSGQRSAVGFLVSSIFWLALVSAMLACLIQMVREPDNIPAPVGVDTAASRETLSILKELAVSSKPASWTVNGKAINQFLESTIEMKPGAPGLSGMSARFQRAFVKLHGRAFTLCVDQKFLGADLYFLLDLQPEQTPDGLRVKPVGGGIGRMPVSPLLLPAFLRLFEPVITGVSQPLELLKKAKSVTITPDDATLQWPGTGTTS